ncbi:MAG: type II secretion system minor pseudopilin GspK [Gammaproteobacteria bacterium]|nr:type II secretion system minor pseudopilin GspK [Gammaproteobacteria bacterium]
MFVVALASIAAAALLSSTQIALRRAENLQDSEAAWWYAQGLEAWVSVLLQREQQAKQSPEDSLGEAWAQPLTYLPFDRGGVSGGLEDLQGRFNLNNLAASNLVDRRFFAQQFNRLLQSIPGIDPFSTDDLAPAIQDWLDPDSEPSGSSGAESPYYLSLDPPYRAANRLMVSPSELLAVSGVTPQLYDALRPYVCALPLAGTKINVNTALAPVLASLASSGPTVGLEGFLKQRVKQPLQSAQAIGQLGFIPAGLNVSQYLDVHTDYFLLHAHIHVGSADLALYSVIRRPTSGSAAVIARSTGTE